MSRDQGFAVADTDTGLYTDPKVRLLWRIVRKVSAMNAAMTLYESVRLASWDAGERITAGDAAPFWHGDIARPQQSLTEAGLLDDEGRIPAHAWEGWFGPAKERREKKREAGRLGGKTSRLPKQSESGGESDAGATLKQPSSDAEPVRTDPSVPIRPVSSEVEHVAALEDVTLLHIDRIDPKTRREFDRLADQRGSSKVAAAIRDVADSIPTQPPAARQLMVEVLRVMEPFSNGTKPTAKGMNPSAEEVANAFRS